MRSSYSSGSLALVPTGQGKRSALLKLVPPLKPVWMTFFGGKLLIKLRNVLLPKNANDGESRVCLDAAVRKRQNMRWQKSTNQIEKHPQRCFCFSFAPSSALFASPVPYRGVYLSLFRLLL